MFLPLSHAALPRALRKIYSIAMPQILDAFVLFASMMQRYEIFTTYARKGAIIFEGKTKYPEIFKYSSIQLGQEGF